MEGNYLGDQELLIKNLKRSCSQDDLFSYGRMLGIDKNEYYIESGTLNMSIEKFIEKIYQRGKEEELRVIISKIVHSRGAITDRAAERFGRLFNTILDKLNKIDESKTDFHESKLIDPVEFEDKMRNKAKLSEDIVRVGIRIKPDISVLRRKAYGLDYNKYMKMIEKLSDYYINHICDKYPVGEYDSDKRYRALNDALLSMIPDELYDADEDIEDTIKGIIFDTIAHCLIFNN